MEESWKRRLKEYISNMPSETDSFTEKEAQVLRIFMQELLMERATTEPVKNIPSDDPMKVNESSPKAAASQATSDSKEFVRYFRSLFYGRQDVFALRWENENAFQLVIKTAEMGMSLHCAGRMRRQVRQDIPRSVRMNGNEEFVRKDSVKMPAETARIRSTSR